MGEKGRKEQKSNQIKSYALIESRKQSLTHSICAFSCPSYPRYLTFYTHYLAHREQKEGVFKKGLYTDTKEHGVCLFNFLIVCPTVVGTRRREIPHFAASAS